MQNILLLAWRYLTFQRWRSFILVGAISLTTFIPLLFNRLVATFEQELFQRAATTPLVIGEKGNRFDLVMNALYFRTKEISPLKMAEVDRIAQSGYAIPIPLVVRYKAQGFPIVGTSLDYFEYRNLSIEKGASLSMLGDCVLGASVAESLGLSPGNHLLSDAENVFDLAGSYPLKMRVVGVLAPTGTVDDQAVFVDVKTTWVIMDIGHGHQAVNDSIDSDLILAMSDQNVVANAALQPFTEITEDNIDSFHFHGEKSELPLTSIIAVPNDEKSATLLRGRYAVEATTDSSLQPVLVVPATIIQELMEVVFQVKTLFDINNILVTCAMLLFLTLVVLLSVRLRKRELQTMFKLGAAPFTAVKVVGSELLLVLLLGFALNLVLILLLSPLLQDAFFQRLLG